MKNTFSDPLGRYHEMINCGELKEDAIQARIVDKFQNLHQQLEITDQTSNKSFLKKLFCYFGGHCFVLL